MWPAAQVGNVRIDPPVVLAPMAGVTSAAFRRLCRSLGAGMVSTEMISANALVYRNARTLAMLAVSEDEHPVSMQLLVAEARMAEQAAATAVASGADVVDINMGCPVPKVLKTRGGADLLRDPDRAIELVRATVHGAQGAAPVSVKLRLGWCPEEPCFLGLALRAQEAGAAAVILHSRFGTQGMSGQADWAAIAHLKAALDIPVIGNGDVFDHQAAERMFGETGCDAVMVGRQAMGDPWVFARLAAAARGLPVPEPPTAAERMGLLAELGRGLVEEHGERRGVRILRGFLCWFTRSLPHSACFRHAATKPASLGEVVDTMHDYAAAVDAGLVWKGR